MSKIVTINIESTDLRFLVVEGKQIKQWGSVPLEPGIVREGLILEPEALSGAISEIIAAKRLSRGKVIASLSGFQVVHRTIELPRVPKKLLAGALLSDAKRAMPVPLEQLYLSWQRLTEEKAESQWFFLLGVPQNLMDAEVNCLRQAGLNPATVNLKPLALARMVNRSEALIINMEQESCDIVVVASGVPGIMRSVPMNSDCSPSERVQRVLQEFERTLRFCESSYLEQPLGRDTPLFLTGMLADDEDLYNVIAAGVGYNVEPLEPPLLCPPDFPAGQYGVNIAMSLKRESSAAKQAADDGRFLLANLNILPDVYRPVPPSARRILAISGVVAGIGLIAPLYLVTGSIADEAKLLREESNKLQVELGEREITSKKAVQEAEDLKAALARMELEKESIPAIRSTMDELQERRTRTYDALCLAIKHSPQISSGTGRLSSITQEDGEMTLDGEIVLPEANYESALYEAYAIALEYADALRGETEWFSHVRVHSLSSGDGDAPAGGGGATGFPGGAPKSGVGFLQIIPGGEEGEEEEGESGGEAEEEEANDEQKINFSISLRWR